MPTRKRPSKRSERLRKAELVARGRCRQCGRLRNTAKIQSPSKSRCLRCYRRDVETQRKRRQSRAWKPGKPGRPPNRVRLAQHATSATVERITSTPPPFVAQNES